MNIFSIIGIVGAFGALIISMFWGGTGAVAFLDVSSVFIVIVASISIMVFMGPK